MLISDGLEIVDLTRLPVDVLEIRDRERWMQEGNCRTTDPDVFFPEKSGQAPHDVRNAKKVCGNCPVLTECLGYALSQEFVFGIWGGTTEDERFQLRNERRSRRHKSPIRLGKNGNV